MESTTVLLVVAVVFMTVLTMVVWVGMRAISLLKEIVHGQSTTIQALQEEAKDLNSTLRQINKKLKRLHEDLNEER